MIQSVVKSVVRDVVDKSGSRYWTQQKINELCLFFASDNIDILNKVVSTQLPNQVTGATDYLTVTGSGLNARYRTPDEDAYRTADSDNVFWKTDGTESICDGNRLIGYDFLRILIKYLDVAPYTIQWIAILKPASVVTNQMRDAFHLSIWWDNVSSNYGRTKENRSGEQSFFYQGYDVATWNLIQRLSGTQTVLLKELIDKTIKDLKTEDIWDDILQFSKANINNENDAKLNWKGNTFPVVAIGSPTYTAKKGWLCAASKYLKSGFIPSVQIAAGVIGETDCGILVDKFESTGDLGTLKINGCFSNGDATKRFQFINYATAFKKCEGLLNCSDAGTVNKNDDVASANGIFYADRVGTKCISYYEGAESFNYDVAGSTPFVDQEIYFGAMQNEVSDPVFYAAEYLRTLIICKSMGATKQLALYNIVKYFNDNIGGTF
jgi:hypothetical protein